MREYLVLLMAGLHLCVAVTCAAAHTAEDEVLPVEVSEYDRERAPIAFRLGPKMRLSAFEQARHADGVRGTSVYTSAMRIYSTRPQGRPHALRLFACNAAVFGLATLEHAQSFVGKDDIGVYTKMRFRITDDWRANAAQTPRTVHLIVQGGEVMYAGEPFRLDNKNLSYRIKGSYFLLAGTRFDPDPSGTIFGLPQLDIVRDDHVYPSDDGSLYQQRTSVAQIKAERADALRTQGCN